MRLIIRENPDKASEYIVNYIISMLHSDSHLRSFSVPPLHSYSRAHFRRITLTSLTSLRYFNPTLTYLSL